MKTTKVFILIAAVLMLASCSYKIYPTKDLTFNYNMRMTTDEELEAKSKVKIFTSEKDVDGEYQVISYLTYQPFNIPIFMSTYGQIKKKFYEKAVMKAYELGGNGIIIMGGGYCKIISLANWVADEEAPAEFVNVIFDRNLMNKFISGEVLKAVKSERKRYESAFKSEITNNMKYAKELDEVAIINEKINAYEMYNSSLDKPKSGIKKDIEKMRKENSLVEKKVNLRLKREAKKAEKAQKSNK